MGKVVVIGAGVIGLSAARELRRRGADVVLLDRGQPGAAASAGNAGWIVPSYSSPLPAPGLVRTSARWMLRRDSPLYIRPRASRSALLWLVRFARACRAAPFAAGLNALADLNARTIELFDELRADGVTFELHREGLLFVGLSDEAIQQAVTGHHFVERFGYGPIERLSSDDVRATEPALSRAVAGGFHIANERHVRPESLTAGLVTWLTEHGVEIRTGVSVESIRRGGRAGAVVVTDAGVVQADQVLVAAGSWSGELLARSGVRLPLEAGKGYSITWDSPTWQLRQPLDLIEAHVACTPFDGALRLAGTMELSGMNERIVPARVEAIRRAGRQYFSESPDGASERVWVGARPLLPDGLPAIGSVDGFDRLFVATGHAMLGVTLAPATAELIAQMMLGKPNSTSTTQAAFEPGRFNRRRPSTADIRSTADL